MTAIMISSVSKNKGIKNLYSRLWLLSWPLILANISVPLLGIIDTAILGHLASPHFLAAVSVGASLTTLVLAGFNFLRMGTTALASKVQPREIDDKGKELFRSSLILAIALGILIIVISPLITRYGLQLMLDTNEEDLFSLAFQYCQVRFLSAPATFVNFILVGWAIALQRPGIALFSLTTTAVANILLDILLILGLGLNSLGAAIASVTAEYSSFFLTFFLVRRSFGVLLPSPLFSLPEFNILNKLATVNTNLFIRSVSLLFCFAYFNSKAAELGVHVVAANAILLQIIALQSYALDGFANATEAMVGRYEGHPAIRSVLSVSLIFSFFAALTISLLLSLIKPWILPLFTHQQAIMDIAQQVIWPVLLLPLLSVFSYWLDGVAVGLVADRAMRNSILVSGFLVFIPACYLLRDLGNIGLWLAFFSFLLARSLTLGTALMLRRPYV